MCIIRERYAMVFQAEGYDVEGMNETLSKYGDIIEIMDDNLDDTPIKIVFIDCSLSKGMRLFLDFNCVRSEENRYVLFPMESIEEKLKVMEGRMAR